MKLTESKLKQMILQALTEGFGPTTKGGQAEHKAAVEGIIHMLRELDDPQTQFRQIEFKARELCKKLGVRFHPPMFQALQAVGVDVPTPFELR